MIIHYLDIPRRIIGPHKTYSELVVYANAVLSPPVAVQLLKAITRRTSQVM